MQFVEAHGAKIPAIGFGTWPLRGEACRRAVSAALEAGYRHIDTAAFYKNEREVGEAVRGSGLPRDALFVTTKVGAESLADGDMQRAVAASLEKLGMDQVDLVLIHWPSRTLSPAATIRTLNEVKRRGMARHIGVSNYTTGLLEESWAASEEPIVVNQCEYHPYLSQAKVIAACRAHGTAFTSYSPLGKGTPLLSDPAVTAIAERLGKSPAQVVLRWHIQQAGVIAVPKSGKPSRIRENLGVFDFALGPEEMAAISALAKPDGRVIDPAGAAPDWDR